MGRRRDEVTGGRWVAGEFGDLFLLTDGVSPLFTWQRDETHPSYEVAAAAWERARVRTWRHEDRENVWPPPIGAKYDGLGSGRVGLPQRQDLQADLAALDAHRRDRPDLSALLADEYDEYAQALELLLGMLDRQGRDALELRGNASYLTYCGIIERRAPGKRAA